MEDNGYVVVIGGMNLDIAGLCGPVYRPSDSNPGKIGMTVGGVGQNIAQNLVRLAVPTYLITVYGDDEFGGILSNACKENGIRLEYAQCIPGGKSSVYLYVTNAQGDMVAAVNEMDITEAMTPEFFAQRLDFINGAKLCVLDANVPGPSIRYLAQNCTAPIFVDPVSVSKVSRIQRILDRIDTLKPNAIEAELLTGIAIEDESSAKAAAAKLNALGVKNVFISLGSRGILCSGGGECVQVPIIPTKIVSANGAGDCSMATIAWARYQFGAGISLARVGQLTQAAASITLEAPEAVSPKLTPAAVLARAE